MRRQSVRPPSGGRWRLRSRRDKPDSGSLMSSLSQLDRESLGALPSPAHNATHCLRHDDMCPKYMLFAC